VIGDIKDRAFKAVGFNNYSFVFTPFKIFVTFVLAAFAWIFFRANSIGDAVYIVTHLTDDITKIIDANYVYEVFNSLGLSLFQILVVFAAIVFLLLSEAVCIKDGVVEFFNKRCFIIRYIYYFVVFAAILLTGVFSDGGQFIYFQF
jgi:hypothetical protein